MAEHPEHRETAADGGFRLTVEHVRANPGMYVGSVGPDGLHHAVFRLVAGSLAEAVAGFGRAVHVTAHSDGSITVSDDGRGLPGSTALEIVPTTRPVAGPPADGRDWRDYLTANALAEWFQVEARHVGRLYRQEFRRGRPTGQTRLGWAAAGAGLSVTVRPDPSVFGDARLSDGRVRDRLRQYAFLHAGVRLGWADRAAGREEGFEYPDGVRSFVAWLNAGRRPLHPDVAVARGAADGVRYEVGLQWCAEDEPAGGAFVNGERTPEFAGPPAAGLRAAVTRALNEFARARLPGAGVLRDGQAGDGLTAVVAVRLADPRFLGARRTRLDNPEVRGPVEAGVGRAMREFLSADPDAAERVYRAAAAPPGGRSPVTTAEWPACTDWRRMLRAVDATAGRRKAVLLAAACGRRLAARTRADRRLAEAVAGYADGRRPGEELQRATGTGPGMRQVAGAVQTPEFGPFAVARLAAALSADDAADPDGLADLVRDVFGNPFRPATFDPSWRTSAAVALARGVYASGDFGPMPILADALQEAGREDDDVLAHCRGGGPHVRGCWVVDLVLGQV